MALNSQTNVPSTHLDSEHAGVIRAVSEQRCSASEPAHYWIPKAPFLRSPSRATSSMVRFGVARARGDRRCAHFPREDSFRPGVNARPAHIRGGPRSRPRGAPLTPQPPRAPDRLNPVGFRAFSGAARRCSSSDRRLSVVVAPSAACQPREILGPSTGSAFV